MSPRDERRGRERRYLITMAVRVLAFVAAIVFATGWIRVIAVILAVVMANAGPKKPERTQPSLYAGERRRELE